jgi:hypothetical protein
MNLRSSFNFALSGVAIAALAVVAACGGGGGVSGPGAVVPAPSASAQTTGRLSLLIKIPQPSSSSSGRHPNYISAATQSIGVVVTNQGFSPSPPQFTNVSSCPSVSGVTECTVSVLAFAGSDVFAITAYSGTNGTGSALSSGSVTWTVSFGGPTPPPLTLGGVISSIAITTGDAYLPLSQTMSANVVAKDASGAAIVGPYDNSIALSGSNLVITPVALPDSTTASSVSVAWTQGYLGTAASTLSGTADGVTGTLTITPASGFAYYTTGTTQAYNYAGFKMILGPDGNLYYGTIGPQETLTNNVIAASSGAVHQFNPTTFTDTEIPLTQSEAIGLAFDSTGALWVGGGPNPSPSASPFLYRIGSATTSFNSSNLTTISVPGTGLSGSTAASIRAVTQDSGTNMWFTDIQGHRLLSIPVAGPYTATAVVASPLPTNPPGTCNCGGPRTIDYANGMLVIGMAPGFAITVNPSSNTVLGEYVSNLETTLGPNASAGLYDTVTDGTNVYFAQIGDAYAAYFQGDIEKFDTSEAFTTLSTVPALGVQPITPSLGDGVLYYDDFDLDGLGFTNPASGNPRMFPMENPTTGFFYGPNGVVAMSDGTAWFTCYGNSYVAPGTVAPPYLPLCVGHTIYVSAWGLWPGTSIPLYGAGPAGAQVVGIMEGPGVNSGPFTVASNNSAICTASSPVTTSDHNFTITGVANGACTVTVTDAHSVSQAISVTVTTTTGTVEKKRRGGIPQ